MSCPDGDPTLGGQGITRQAFCERLRVRLGKPSLNELPAECVTEGIDAALRDLSKAPELRFERQNLIFFLQPLQELYEIPGCPDFIFDVVPAAPTTASARAFGQEFRAIELDLIAFEAIDLQTHFYRVSQFREMFETLEWHYDAPPFLFVSPAPIQAVEAIVIVGNKHTVETIPISHEETLVYGSMAFTQEIWSNRRDSLAILETPSAVGTIRALDGTKLQEKSTMNMKRFRQRLGWDRPYVGQG